MKTWLLFFIGILSLQAQFKEPVVWSSRVEPLQDNRYLLHFEAKIAPNWHLYSQFSNPEGAIPTAFVFEPTGKYTRIGTVTESESTVDYDQVFEMDLTYFKDSASFQQQIEVVDAGIKQIKVEINYQACDDELCIFRTEAFVLSLDGSVAALSLEIDEKSKSLTAALQLPLSETQFLEEHAVAEGSRSPLNLFLLGFFG